MPSAVGLAFLLLTAYAGPREVMASSPGQPRTDEELVPVELTTVGIDQLAGTPIVLLRDPESGDVVPIWVGLAEAQAIARALHGVEVPRPMTHDLMASLLAEMKAEVEEVVVQGLQGNTYFGLVRLRLAGEQEVRDVDSRPSDALALALRTDAPILVARSILVAPPDFEFLAPEGPEQVVQALGITVVAVTSALRKEFDIPEQTGVVVTHASGRARDEGLRRGDLIIEINGQSLEEPVDFFEAIRGTSPGAPVQITYWRHGNRRQIELPADLPPERRGRGRRVVV